MIYSNRKRVRVDFAPLTLAVSTVCLTPNSSLTQVWNAQSVQFEPDRSVSPCVVLPKVVADASDGSWTQHTANSLLANIKWLENGVDISTINEWRGLFDIESSGDNRGALTVRRNIEQGRQVSLVFTAELLDQRTGTLYKVESEPVVLSSVTKARDIWHINCLDSPTQIYDLASDRLLEFDYCAANGIPEQARATSRSEASDGHCYRRVFDFRVYCGREAVTSGFSMSYWRLEDDGTMERLSPDSDEVESMGDTQLVLDLRFIASGCYLAAAEDKDGRFLAQYQFSVTRVYPQSSFRTMNGTSLETGDTIRHDTAMVDDGSHGILRHPQLMFKMTWLTDSPRATAVAHNEGLNGRIRLKDAGVNLSTTSDWIETYIGVEEKPPHAIATDADGNVYADADGNDWFFN